MDLTLMIQTCQGYSDLWQPHMRLLAENWPDRNIPTLLVTDCPTQAVFPGVEVLAAGAGKHLPARLAAALPRVETAYILLTLDDYFLTRPISTARIAGLVDKMDREGLDYIRLFPRPGSRTRLGNTGLFAADLTVDYAVNLYPGIWRKTFLEQTLAENRDIWTYEVSLTHTARQAKARCALSKGQEFPILDVVRKGRLLHKARTYLSRRDLYQGNRRVTPWREEARIFLFTAAKELLPRPAAQWGKAQLRRLGMRFYSDRLGEACHD